MAGRRGLSDRLYDDKGKQVVQPAKITFEKFDVPESSIPKSFGTATKPATVTTPKVELSTPDSSTEQSFFGRVGNTVTGGLLGSGAGFTNTLGTLFDSAKRADMNASESNRKAAQERENANRYREMLKRGTMDDGTKIDEKTRVQLEKLITSSENRAKVYEESNVKQHENISKLTQQTYEKADELARKSQEKIEQAKVGTSDVGKLAVDIGAAGTQLLGDIAAGAVTGAGAMVPIFLRGFGSGAQQARQNGATYEQQLAYGLGSATVEALTEKIASVGSVATKAFGKGALDDITKGVIRAVEDRAKTAAGKQAINRLASLGTGFVGEGLEEAVSALVDPLLQKATYDKSGEKIDWETVAHDAAYQFLIGGVLGGVMGGIGGTDTSTVDNKTKTTDNKSTSAPVSPAASPEVQQVQAQAEVTKAQNPEAEVLDAATTLFTQQGMNLNTAQKRAEIVGKLIRGEEVSDKDLNRIDPTSKQTKQIFTQLTGVQFPESATSIEALRNLYRSAHTVAQAAEVQVATVAENATAQQPVSLADQMAQAGYQTSAETQTRIDEAVADLGSQVSNIDIGPDGKPLASLSTFAEAYRGRVNPNATDEEVREQYKTFRENSRTILFGNHRLTKSQFTKLMRDNGKNLTDEQVDQLFNQAILDTLDGKDAFDRYTKKVDTGDKSNDGGIGQKQKEDNNGRTDARAENGDSREVEQGRSDGRGYRDGRRGDSSPETAVRDRTGQAEGKQAHLFSRGVQPLGRLSGLNNPRTRKTKIPDVKGTVQVVYRSDYTDEMKTAHMIARELGYTLNVTTGSFYADFAGKYRRCTGLADRKNHIFTVSARERGQTNFWSTFRHELFHLFGTDRSFQTKFFMRLTEVAKVPGLASQDAVTQYLRRVTQKNEYLAPYRDEFDTLGLSANDKSRCLWEEMCAEFLANNNDGLQLDQQIFDALHEAAVKVFDEISPAYEAKIKEQVRQDRMLEKGYRLAEQQDTVDKERSDEVERPDRAFSLPKEQYWDEQLDGLADDADTQNALYIKETPNILAEIGLGDLPMCMTKSHAKDSLHPKDESNPHWHGVPESVMMRLPDLLSAPAMVLNSQTKRGDILVVLNAVDNDKLPIVAAIHPNGMATVDNVRGPANFILSVYGRNNFARKIGEYSKNNLLYLALKDRNILYWNKKKTEHIAHLSGLQLPETMNKIPSDTILKPYRGYVKDRIPERMFSLDKEDDGLGDIEAKLEEIEQKNKALSDLVSFIEKSFPSEAKYNFSTWMNAMHYLDSTSATKLCFDSPTPFDTEVDVGFMENGKWVSVATFENNKEGLAKFNRELDDLIQKTTLSEVEPEFAEIDDLDDIPDDILLEDEDFDFDLLDIYDDSTQYHGEDDETQYYRQREMDRAQFGREGFTDTDSKAFKKWFNDDSGMLTGKDGRPKVFFRGSPYTGSTKFRPATGARSRGIFFSDQVAVATEYAEGASLSHLPEEGFTAQDQLKGHRWNKATREWKPYNFKSWHNARKYISDNFMDDAKWNGIDLVGINAETGEIMPSSKADIFILSTNITTKDHRLSTPGRPLFTEDGFRELKSYPATKKGLTELNRDLGDFVRELGMGMRGYSKFYLSAENTFVLDAQYNNFGELPDDLLPEKLHANRKTGSQSINMLAEKAFENGYDCLIVTNVNDAGGIQTQYVVKDPTQVKSVYNRGTWNRKDPDFMFSIAKEDYLMDYLDHIEMEYGGGFAQDVFDSFEAMDLSRRVAEAMSNIEASVGAAQSGFDPYSHIMNEYGTIEPGENPARVVDVPTSTNGKDTVSKTVRTVSEAKATPDSRLETIEQAVVGGKLSYIPIKNKVEARKAEYKIKALGWTDALAEWTAEVRQGNVSARLIAEGATLLNNAGNHPECTGAQYTSLLVDYTNMLRVAGQAVQAARILKTLTPDAKLYSVEKIVQNLNDQLPESLRKVLPDGIKVDEALIEEYRNAKTAEELEEIMDRILQNIADQIPSTLMDKFTALRYLNMLGNFKTQVRNVVGNTMLIPVRKVKDSIGAIIEASLVARGKDIERTKSITRDKATYHACVKDYEVVRDIVMGGGKYEDSRRYAREIEDKRRIFKSKFWESYRKATNWAMNNKYFGDEGFSRFAYADAMARYLAANKVTFEQATTDMLDKAREYAIQQAAEATYRDNNAFSVAISQMRFHNPNTWAKKGINTIGEGLLPFRRTPANILVRAIEYNPIGFITTAASNIYGTKVKGETLDASKLIDQLSKNLTGTGICALGYLLFSMGLLRGKEPEEEKLAQYEELLGHQAYSIELPNGMSLTLDWLAPASIPLFLGAQFADAALENGLTFREGLEALGSITDPMLQMSMLQGVNDALENASTYGNDSALVRLTGNSLWSFFTQGLTNTLLGQIERSLSTDRMTTYVDKNKDVPDALQRLLGQASAKTPGVDYNQIPYIDAWGRVDQNAVSTAGNIMNQFFNPAYSSRVKESKMESELRRLYEATGTSGVLPSRAKSYFNVDKQRLDLTAEQYIDYASMKGQTSYAVLTDLTDDSLYKSLPDEIKEKAVVKAMDFANEISKASVTGYGPEKWDAEPKKGNYDPDSWVKEAAEDADKYGIPVATYALAAAQISVVTGIPDEDGETISGSKAVQKALIIKQLGLNEKQTDKLMEDFDVGKSYKNLSEKALQKKLDKWSK